MQDRGTVKTTMMENALTFAFHLHFLLQYDPLFGISWLCCISVLLYNHSHRPYSYQITLSMKTIDNSSRLINKKALNIMARHEIVDDNFINFNVEILPLSFV